MHAPGPPSCPPPLPFPSFSLLSTLATKIKAPKPLCSADPSVSVLVCVQVWMYELEQEVCMCARVCVCVLLQICSLWISQKQQQGKWGVKVSGLLRINRSSLINHPTAACICVCVCVCVGVCLCVGAYQMDLLKLCPALMLLLLMHMCSGHLSKCHVRSSEFGASPISLKPANETAVLCYCSISHRSDINRKSGLRCIRQTMCDEGSHTCTHTHRLSLSEWTDFIHQYSAEPCRTF